MVELRHKQFELVVIGAGPAGLAAAATAAECGSRVALLDDNANLGGQIWRGEPSQARSPLADWAERLKRSGVEVFCSTQVLHVDHASRVLLGENAATLWQLKYARLILATGARERFLPFPGWTLPNVMAAGGLQAMAKSGLPMAGRRVVVAGTGPLLLAVAAHLRQQGAEVLAIVEQASWSSLARFGAALIQHPRIIGQALGMRRVLTGVPFYPSSWPVRAQGYQKLEAVIVQSGRKSREIACDYLACGFHLVPNSELPALLGVHLHNGFAAVDDAQQSSVPDIFCAGELTGIGGFERALLEGQIAGFASSGQWAQARALQGRRRRLQKFAAHVAAAFDLRPELKNLPEPSTIVCRCEDIIHAALTGHTSWRAAKLQTRCGMGACQGRVCGSAVQFLFGWQPDSVRPPIFPTRLEHLASFQDAPGEN